MCEAGGSVCVRLVVVCVWSWCGAGVGLVVVYM